MCGPCELAVTSKNDWSDLRYHIAEWFNLSERAPRYVLPQQDGIDPAQRMLEHCVSGLKLEGTVNAMKPKLRIRMGEGCTHHGNYSASSGLALCVFSSWLSYRFVLAISTGSASPTTGLSTETYSKRACRLLHACVCVCACIIARMFITHMHAFKILGPEPWELPQAFCHDGNCWPCALPLQTQATRSLTHTSTTFKTKPDCLN